MKSNLFLVLAFAHMIMACGDSQTSSDIGQVSSHPSLILTKAGVNQIKKGGDAPLFEKTKEAAIAEIDQAIKNGIDVPMPKDMAGGYTHERHKLNYREMHLAGALYQITGKTKYAEFIKEMLMEYARMYPTLPIHPTNRSYATGKIFWQCLNDANWMVYTSQAYDCIYDYLTSEERTHLETELFRPYAEFLSVGNPQFFNRVHNHSTWANAAVGMMGIVMNDSVLIQRALYGLPLDAEQNLEKDNDGGYIYEKGKSRAGFFAQIDFAFSPDGYYTEGPYYQRYAMSPFMFFAQAINNNLPVIKIFDYRNGLLQKAVYALLYQTNATGEFFPINDAQKGMSFKSQAVIAAVNIAYGVEANDQLMDVAKQQGTVLLDQNGFGLARGIATGTSKPFIKKSIELTDGPKGDEGALGILRSGYGENEITVAFKYTAQGLGHGHYDKLSYLMYDGSSEVLQDYGAARWVNVDQKGGGRYLKENKTWSKQTIAHNTLVVDQESHFRGAYAIATAQHSDPYFFDASDANLQAASAKEVNAYPGIEMQRTLLLWNYKKGTKPVLIDVMSAFSDQTHTYELPVQYSEQIMQTNFEYKLASSLQPMGTNHGYQHIYKEAEGQLDDTGLQFNWFNDNKFNTITAMSEHGDKAILARAGANDPNFNIRRDAMMIHRKDRTNDALFISLVEPHGVYSTVTETPLNPFSNFESVNKIYHTKSHTVFSVTSKDGISNTFGISNQDSGKDSEHIISVNGKSYEWTGPFASISKTL